MNVSSSTVPSQAASTSATGNALALPDPPAPVKTKEQDIIDLLSITLSTTETSPHNPHPHTPSSNQNLHQVPVSPSTQAYPHASQTYPGTQGQTPYNNYVVPWAQPHQQTQAEAQPQHQPPAQPYQHMQPQPSTYSSVYPPPPWAATPGYYSNQSHLSTNNAYATHTNTRSYTPLQGNTTASYTPVQSVRPLQQYSSFAARENGLATNGDSRGVTAAQNPAPPGGQKPFIPSYRLFEDLNVFGNGDGRLKVPSGSASSSLAGTSSQSMVGGRK